MEKKRWVFIFSALCLALAFSVSSVEAQDICTQGDFCDSDHDKFFRDHKRCDCGDVIGATEPRTENPDREFGLRRRRSADHELSKPNLPRFDFPVEKRAGAVVGECSGLCDSAQFSGRLCTK